MARGSSPPPKPSPALTQATVSPPETAAVRLHIVPLTPETAASLLPASVLTPSVGATISYHTLPTFPERPYAFVTLPVPAADALKKKLHGSTFRGVKVSVEEARPQRSPPGGMKDDAEKTKKELKAERREKRKREDGEGKVKKRKKGETKDVIEGAQLPEGRKVARGWAGAETTSVSKKYTGRSSAATPAAKEDTKRECLFKTPLPPNRVPIKDDKKKDKEEKKEKKERKRNKEVTIREFKNNTKSPAFLKGSQLGEKAAENMASEYVDGVGWVNGWGEVVEEENRKRRAADVVQTGVVVTETAIAEESGIAPKPVKPVDKYKGTVLFEDADEAMTDVGSKKEAASKYVSDDSSSDSELGADPETESRGETEVLPKTSTAAKVTPASGSESSGEESDESESEAESESKDLPATTNGSKPTPSSDSESSDEKLGSELGLSSATTASDSDSDSDSDSSDKEESDESDVESGPSTKTSKPSQTTPVTLPIHSLPSTPKTPILKTAIPTLQITIPILNSPPPAIVHPLEALYKPTATLSIDATTSSSDFKFGFGATDDDDDDDDDNLEEASPVAATPYRERYRSAAPTPDTAIGHHRFFPDENDLRARLAFVPSTPHGGGGGGITGAQGLFSRGAATAAATAAAVESPLLFLHPESRFLGALSVWSQLPTPKAFVPDEPVVEEEEAGEGKGKKGKKGKRVVEEMEQGERVEMTAAEVWSERFYEKRGEWNRAWKGRRREVLKAKRKRGAGGNGAPA